MAVISIRTARINDLEVIVKIAIGCIPQEPQVLYQYPGTFNYPEGIHRCDKEEIKSFIANGEPLQDIDVIVAEIQDSTALPGKTIIAHSVWDLMAVGKRNAVLPENEAALDVSLKTVSCDDCRDANWNWIKFYSRIIEKIVWKYLEPSDRTSKPRSYIHLIQLATSPTWQHHGAGTHLTN